MLRKRKLFDNSQKSRKHNFERVARKKLRNLELSKQKYHTVILCNKKLENKKMFSSKETINFKAIFLDTYETFKLKK